MTENQKQWLTWVILTLVTLAIALFFGVQYPMPEQPAEPIHPIELAANFSNPVDIEGSSSADAPALTFESDTNTGIFRSAADTLNISTGGAERLEIDSSELTIVPPVSCASTLTVSGKLDLTDQLAIAGSADEVQLAVTGYTTQTSDLVTLDGGLVDIGGATAGVADGDNDLAVAGVLEVDGEIEADGPIDLDDNMTINGTTDEVQLAVTGYTTQTSDLVTFDGGLVDIGGASASVADGDDDLAVAGVLEVDGELEADGPIDADSTVSIGSWLSLDKSDFSATSGATLTPTTSLVQLSSAGAVSIYIADGTDEGQILILHHGGGPGITIDESEFNCESGGDVVMAASDTALYIWDGAKWYHIAHGDN